MKEARTGHADWQWLHLAVQLLTYLDECDLESNEGWNPIGPFQKEVSAGPHGLREEDVQQVIAYLSTPTEVYFLKEDCPVSTKDTALIERRSMRGHADMYRLTQRGRLALELARLSHSWLYAHHDAGKQMTAIQYGEFQDLPRQCSALGQSVRAFSHEITRIMEQPGKTEQIRHFLERGSQYLDSIRKVQGAVRNARELLATAEVRDRFEHWSELRGEQDLSLGMLRRSLDELMQSVPRKTCKDFYERRWAVTRRLGARSLMRTPAPRARVLRWSCLSQHPAMRFWRPSPWGRYALARP